MKRSIEDEKEETRERLLKNIKRLYGCKDKKAEMYLAEELMKAKNAIKNLNKYKNFSQSRDKMPTKENLYSTNGYFLRSKNEMIFESKLDELGIPYLFEIRLDKWNCGQIMPDFTIFVNNEVIHIELLGLLNNLEYCIDFESKQRRYEEMKEKVIYLDVTDGIDMRKIEKILYKILNCIFNGLNGPNGLNGLNGSKGLDGLYGRIIRCAPETANRTSII